ncbi:DUF4410 domain-containing protein [Acidisoma sp. C75]
MPNDLSASSIPPAAAADDILPSRRRGLGLLLLLGLAPLAGCAGGASGHAAQYVAPPAAGGAQLPRPGLVYVYPFTIDPKTIQLDKGMRARLEALSQTADPAAARRQIAQEVQEAISETLIARINALGLPAVAADARSRARLRPGDVVVQGQITGVDAGNAARRAVIGFGAGKSTVYATSALLQVRPNHRLQPLQSYDAEANSGRTPGLAVGAAGLAAGHVALAAAGAAAGTVKRGRTGLAKDGEVLAEHVAANFAQFFAAEGWIPPR